MKITTKYFGEIEYDQEDILMFPHGLFAFEKSHSFLLIPFSESNGSLFCLQNIDDSNLTFVAMDPFLLNAQYRPVLRADELEELEVSDSRQLCYYTLCVLKKPVSDCTVNLRCPIVLNGKTRKALQVILEDTTYGMRHLLSKFSGGHEK